MLPTPEYQVASENENDLNLPANVSVLDEQLWPSPPRGILQQVSIQHEKVKLKYRILLNLS